MITASGVLFDFCWMALLLFVSQLIRSRIRVIQKLYIPSALIAGILGLFAGKFFLNIIPYSDAASSYSGILIAILFSTLFLGSKGKKSFKGIISKVSDSFLVNTFAEVGQYAVFMLIGCLVFVNVFPQLNPGFALMLPSGFIGGHGTAAAIGAAFADNGWDEATTIGQTFATAGLVIGILLGVVCINIATRKGYTKVIKKASLLPNELLTGLIPEGKRENMGENTVSSMSIDPLTWHLILVLISVGGAYLANYGLKLLLPSISFPVYALALIVSVVLQKILELFKLSDYVDKRIITRIGSTATDFLVGFGVATININIVIKYWFPMVILIILGIAYCLFFLFVISKKCFRSYWFERGIYVFGMLTGVMSTGVILLRVCDPELKTGVLEDFGLAWIILSFIDLLMVSLSPMMIVWNKALIWSVGCFVFSIACLIVNYYIGKKQPKTNI